VAFSPRAGVTYRFLPSLAAHVSAYHAFRAPILAQLYRRSVTTTTITLPNPNLSPETATGYEGGVDWQPEHWLQVKGTIYRADYHDFNGFVTTSAAGAAVTTRQRQNVQATRSIGGEGFVELLPVERLSLVASFSYDDARITGLGPVAPTATTFVGARLTQTPYQRATVRATYDSRVFGTWTALARHEGSATLNSGLTLPEFTVVDATVSRQVQTGIEGFVGVENLFDRAYDVNVSGSATAPLVSLGIPRTFRMGVTLSRY
jgi:outer membrane receptor protein involved in Fe transport